MSDNAIRSGLAALLKTNVSPAEAKPVAGGDTNRCFRYETDDAPVFVKVAPASMLEAFEVEAEALKELQFADAVRVPQVRAVGRVADHALLILEWLTLRPSTSKAQRVFGERLAQLHRTIQPKFGWEKHNFIGRSSQTNTWCEDWLHFWRTYRLDKQLNLAAANGADGSFMERAALLSVLMDAFFVSHRPEASLLHGDLWSGNFGVDETDAPVIFDPAVYYGDRECDLAMTRLFGGFRPEFHAAYEAVWPLPSGWRVRVELYNLYHVLNHHNLFGGDYLSRARTMVDKLLAELGH